MVREPLWAAELRRSSGFSLLELLIALAITLVLSAAGFQLFRYTERVFQDQNLISEKQQNGRAVLIQINDEIRRAGQGVPVYAATYDSIVTEALVVVLDGSDGTHLRIREGYSGIETVASATPAEYTVGVSRSITVSAASLFSDALSTTAPHGTFAYIWGAAQNSRWSWVRAEIVAISGPLSTLTVIPRQIGESCRSAPDTVRFTAPQIISLEESASIYFNDGSIWRTTAADMTDPTSVSWISASEIGRQFAGLTFTYYDSADNIVQAATLSQRAAIVRIDASVRTQGGLSMTMRGYPRNLRVR